MSANAAVPAHVDPKRVFDFNIFDDRRFAEQGDPYLGLAQLRKEGLPGIFWSTAFGGHWVIQDHDLVFEAMRATDIFSSNKMTIRPSGTEGQEEKMLSIPLTLDPPAHTSYRKPLQEAFAPKAMAALEGDIRKLAGELIDAVADKGACDFFSAVAELLPVTIFMRLAGMPVERLGEFRALVRQFLGSHDAAVFADAKQKMLAEVDALIADHRRTKKDDLVGRLLIAKVDGHPVTDEEARGYVFLLVIAGLDTVANAIGFGVRYLAHDLALQERLRANPADIPEAAEELLRRHSVAQTSRCVTQDIDWHGVSLRKNDRVLVLLASANTDPKVFERPGEVDIDRQNKTHITFNAGPHRCVGSHLARLELRILYEEWLKRIPTFRPDPNKPERVHATQIFGLESLPLVWDPTKRRAAQ